MDISDHANLLRLFHPGKVLRKGLMFLLEMSIYSLAMAFSMPAARVDEIVKEGRSYG